MSLSCPANFYLQVAVAGFKLVILGLCVEVLPLFYAKTNICSVHFVCRLLKHLEKVLLSLIFQSVYENTMRCLCLYCHYLPVAVAGFKPLILEL